MVMIANQCGMEVGFLAGRYPGALGHLYSPGAQDGPFPFLPYALDNGAFIAWLSGVEWNEAAWKRLLLWAAMSGQLPLWALVPDVVMDRAATIERWHRYVGEVRRYGFRPAFALQDGMTFEDVPDPDCMLFLGGYRLELTIEGEEDEATGMLVEYDDLDRVVRPILKMFDHHDANTLNERCSTPEAALVAKNPTVERIARWFYARLAGLIASARQGERLTLIKARVWEDPKSSAEWP